ncbi:hypothetical protein PL11201_670051 [Planktothrix sp. PCC 11201]|nr:hypothetical protein PL11201_670051 [Planktothrix sp. PCC 11201]
MRNLYLTSKILQICLLGYKNTRYKPRALCPTFKLTQAKLSYDFREFEPLEISEQFVSTDASY